MRGLRGVDGWARFKCQRGEFLIRCVFYCVTSFVISEASQFLTAPFSIMRRHVPARFYAALRAGVRYVSGMVGRYGQR